MSLSRKQRRLARFRARLSLQQSLDRFDRPQPQRRPNDRSAALAKRQRDDITALQTQIDKLDRGIFRLAVFGSVSRGKSALINGLLGRELLPTGPTNGVTQWPQSLLWADWDTAMEAVTTGEASHAEWETSDRAGHIETLEAIEAIQAIQAIERDAAENWDLVDDIAPERPLRIELVDTPGIDEIGGDARATMATEVAQQVDAVLFVVSGDVTQTEYDALCELWQSGKPIVVVFNKIDLYPELDRQTIIERLQALGDRQQLPLRPDEIVLAAAQPAPVLLQEEDGSTRWYEPPAQLGDLKRTIARIVQRDGDLLLAINALVQAKRLEQDLATTAIELRERDAEALIWNFVRAKSAIVACTPLLAIDVLSGTVADLICIRQLAQLYGLPMTNHEAGRLLKTIVWSNGGLLLGEMLTGMSLGAGKVLGVPGFVGSAITQAGIAGVGVYLVGQAAKEYLEAGCTWGPLGADTVMRDILARADRDGMLDRVRREFLSDSSQ